MSKPLVAIALALSGAASLTLESLWFEWLALHWGRTAEASAVVLASFMLGLGLGQWLILVIKRLPLQALSLWALAEALVALLAMLANWRFSQTINVLDYSAILWILLPTLVMGMTLPLAISSLRQSQFSNALTLAYASNTAGAAAGVIATAWWFTPQFGLLQTGHIAVIAQLLAALLIVMGLKRWLTQSRASRTTESTYQDVPTSNNSRISSSNSRLKTLAAVAASGFFVLGMEILWFRALLLSHRSTSENFALMLAVVLLGLAIGSACANAYLKRRAVINFQAALAFMLSLQALLCLLGFSLWQPNSSLSIGLNALILIAPACLCSGAIMVLAASSFSAAKARQNSARLILASTVGSTLAAPLVALYLLPGFGVASSLQLLLALLCCTALVTAWSSSSKASVFTATIVIAIVAAPLENRWRAKQQRAAAIYQQLDNGQVVAQTDGKYQSVQLLKSDFLGSALSYRLLTDSYSMTSTATDSERYMRLLAWLPQAMNSQLSQQLLISYGVGTSATALLQNPATKKLVIADPSASILETSRIIHRSAQPLDDPRVELRLSDGRKVLKDSPQQFDLITGEPPPPRLAGMHALYSQEYFQLMADALRPQGWASYWLPVDQLSLKSSKAIIQAFCKAFSDCSLWAGSHYNWILLGSNKAVIDSNALSSLWQHQADDLANSGFESSAQLASSFIAHSQALKEWAGEQAALSDNWPRRIQDQWPSAQDIQQYAQWMEGFDTQRRFQASNLAQAWGIPSHTLDLAWALQPLMNGQYQVAVEQRLALLEQIIDITAWQTPLLWVLGTDQDHVQLSQGKKGSVAALHRAVGLLAQRQFAQAHIEFSTLAAAAEPGFSLAAELAAISQKYAVGQKP